jgi:FtsH-binding integral membrane protein
METNNDNFNIFAQSHQQAGDSTKAFMVNVFSWMFAALTITAVMSYLFGTNLSLITMLVGETGMKPLGYVVMFAPIGFVLLMSFGFNKLSYSVLLILFIAYAIIMGISLSFIFLIYTSGSIYVTFGVSALMFGIMALVGYTTNTDLTRLGNILMMALVGMIIAGIVNFFMKSDTMSYIISFIGVIVFTGLTAYDVQKLKNIGSGAEYGTESTNKLAIMGALNLYLDFINLFLSLLRMFGDRK